MKFSPVPTTGIAVAAVAAISATAVALKKKGKKLPVARASFTDEEWKKFRNWPALEKTEEKAEEPAVKEESSTESENVADAPTVSVDEAVDDSDSKPKASIVIIGEGEGKIKPFSPEYKEIIKNAQQLASEDEEFTLSLYGKTYGLGAKGQAIEGDTYPGTIYVPKDIEKLYKKAFATPKGDTK